MNAIQIIKAAVKGCNDPELDKKVYFDVDIGMMRFEELLHGKVFIDVPPRALVCLGRKDFWKKDDTWRDVLDGVHGKDWTHDVFQYFSSDLKENSFNQPVALHDFRLLCVGGACRVGNGNHRAVAGKGWLISQHGSGAIFKKANVQYYRLAPEVKTLLVRALKEKLTVHIANAGGHGGVLRYIQLSNDTKRELLAWRNTGITLERESGKLITKLLCAMGMYFYKGFDWKPVPANVVEQMIDDAWALAQI